MTDEDTTYNSRRRSEYVRRVLTGAGVTGLKAKASYIYGLPGTLIVVVTGDRYKGARSLYEGSVLANKTQPTILVRARRMPSVKGWEQTPVVIPLGMLAELLAVAQKHPNRISRGGGT